MSPQSLEQQVEELSIRVTVLEQLPAQFVALELQISQLRQEMHAEFSAVRSEIHPGNEETRRVLRDEIRTGDEETRRVLRNEIRAGDEETRRVLRDEIRAGDEETRRQMHLLNADTLNQMRVLHEDLVGRLALLADGKERRGQP